MAGRAFGMFNELREAKFRNVYTYGWMPSWISCVCLEEDQPRGALKSSPDILRCCHYGLCRRKCLNKRHVFHLMSLSSNLKLNIGYCGYFKIVMAPTESTRNDCHSKQFAGLV